MNPNIPVFRVDFLALAAGICSRAGGTRLDFGFTQRLAARDLLKALWRVLLSVAGTSRSEVSEVLQSTSPQQPASVRSPYMVDGLCYHLLRCTNAG